MEKLKKYLLFLFLLENVAAQTRLMGGISTYFFYAFLVLGAMFMLQRDLWKGETMGTYWPLYVMGGIYVLYEFIWSKHNKYADINISNRKTYNICDYCNECGQ